MARRILAMMSQFLALAVIVSGVHARNFRHHINVCNFLPTDKELAEIAERGSEEGVSEYSHKLIHIKTFTPREHMLISILEGDAGGPQEYMYLVQATQGSGKPVGHFKSFDEDLPMRKCDEKEIFYNNETMELSDGEVLAEGITFEWVAPNTKAFGPVTVIVTKVNMNLLHRHRDEDTLAETAGPEA